jgi:hypothetical protein
MLAMKSMVACNLTGRRTSGWKSWNFTVDRTRDEQARQRCSAWNERFRRSAFIERFIEAQRVRRNWINFAEIADDRSKEDQSIVPNEAKRTAAYQTLLRDFLAGDFEENGRSRVLFLCSWSAKTRVTRGWLQVLIAIFGDFGDDHIRAILDCCWIQRRLFERWLTKHRLGKLPARFLPQQDRAQPSNKGGRPEGADWGSLQDRLAEQIKIAGWPNRQNTPGWRRTKDVVEWLIEEFGNELEDVEQRTIEDNVRKMLRALKTSAKPVSR